MNVRRPAALAAGPTPATPAAAAVFFVDSLNRFGVDQACASARPVVADDGSVAFLDIREHAFDEPITVKPAFGGKIVLRPRSTPSR